MIFKQSGGWYKPQQKTQINLRPFRLICCYHCNKNVKRKNNLNIIFFLCRAIAKVVKNNSNLTPQGLIWIVLHDCLLRFFYARQITYNKQTFFVICPQRVLLWFGSSLLGCKVSFFLSSRKFALHVPVPFSLR